MAGEYIAVCDIPFGSRPPYPDVKEGCASPYYMLAELVIPPDSAGAWPALSVEDGAQIGMAIAMCWVIGWAWREIRRALSASGNRE